jgi:ubiquinone/menaquinone biosynthesis C-methylase UbiE
MTKNHPSAPAHDYLPAAGRDAFLRCYDPLTALLGAARLHGTLIDQAGLGTGQRVLEIGCGTGNLAIRARRTHPDVEVVGCDPDPLALARAQRKARGLAGIRFERAYAQKLPYPDGRFDRVLSSLMLHHLDHDTKVAAAAEIRRVLRPGGSLHLVDFVGQTHGVHGFLASRVFRSGHVTDNHDSGIPRLFTAAGLECDEVAVRRAGVLGSAGYYRATRPAD